MSNKLNITREQRDNLELLAGYLLSNNLKAEFDMSTYDQYEDDNIYHENCGSVGCAIGHGPYAGIPKNNEHWEDYCARVFGIDINSLAHLWCFSAYWENYDNSPESAATRILYMLENGVPEEFNPTFICDYENNYELWSA